MMRSNLFLLEHMIQNRIEKDSERLEAIKSINELLSLANIDIDTLIVNYNTKLFNDLANVKGNPLTIAERELVEKIIAIGKLLFKI